MVPREIKPAGSRLPRGTPNSRNSRLDTLKHRLLQDPDWAAVSAARPLEITFAPAEEIERFGKRRKLNDNDRKRLSAAYGSNSQLSLLKSRETNALWNTDLDQVQIRINGRPVGMQQSDSQGMTTTNTSSQSMLLDYEETPNIPSSVPAKKPWIPSPHRLSLQPNFGHASRRFETPISPPPRMPAFEDVGSIKRRVTPVLERYPFADTNIEHGRGVSERSVTLSPSVPDSPRPRRRHYTSHDQALTEQIMAEERAQPPEFEPSRSSLGIPGASPHLLTTDTLPYPIASSWLPQPQRSDVSSSPHTARSHVPVLTHPVVNKSPRSIFSPNPFLDVPESNYHSPTAKVFGQIVQIRSDGAAYE